MYIDVFGQVVSLRIPDDRHRARRPYVPASAGARLPSQAHGFRRTASGARLLAHGFRCTASGTRDSERQTTASAPPAVRASVRVCRPCIPRAAAGARLRPSRALASGILTT